VNDVNNLYPFVTLPRVYIDSFATKFSLITKSWEFNLQNSPMKKNSSPQQGSLLYTRKSYYKIFNKWSVLVLLALLVVGCKKVTEQQGLVGVCPKVISTDPADVATAVSLNRTVDATFNEAINPATINTTTFTITQGTTPVAGLVTYTGMTATFSPANSFLPNTLYTGTITTGVKDMARNALISNYVWTFTTGVPDLTPPKVISTDPVNAATGVAVDKLVSATFDEVIDSLSAVTSFTIANTTQGGTAVSGSVSYSGMTAVFTPLFNLGSNTTYTAIITTGAKDLAGNHLANNYTWSFTTGVSIVPPGLLGSDSLFGAFGGNAGITNQGLFTVINNGSIGTTAASTLITGFHDGAATYTETPLDSGNVTGTIFTAPPAPGNAASFTLATKALLDANASYNSISPASKPGGMDPGAGELGGLTLAPGIYKSASGTFNIANGDLTLDAMGDPNAQWIFQTAAGLTVGVAGPAGARSVKMINGASPRNVYWYVGSAAVINGAGGGVMVGTIIASSGVTFSTAGNAALTVLNGRAISLVASVTMVNTIINVP